MIKFKGGNMEKNIKLYPFYKMFAFNILFWSAISLLYLIEVKNLSIYQIAIVTSVYFFFSIFLQVPAAIICDRIGLKTAMMLGNLFLLTYTILLIIVPNYQWLLFAEFFCAFGYSLSGCSDSPFLYSSLKKVDRTAEFSKIESRGFSYHFIMTALTAIAAGYLYRINPYLPIVFASSFLVVANLICYNFESIKTSFQKIPIKDFIGELRSGFKFIFNSARLRALLLFAFIFVAILNTADLLMRTYLSNVNAAPIVFGYFFAAISVVAAIGSLLQRRIEALLRKRTLSSLGLYHISITIMVGILLFIFASPKVLLVVGILLFLMQSLIKKTYVVIIQKYLSRYTTNSVRSKILSIYNMIRHLGSFLLMLLISYFLKTLTLAMSFTLLGLILFVIMIVVSLYMDPRVGKKPEEYFFNDRLDIMEDISNKIV